MRTLMLTIMTWIYEDSMCSMKTVLFKKQRAKLNVLQNKDGLPLNSTFNDELVMVI